MFNRLTYKVRFAVPDKTLEGAINFQEGLTAIVGPNGKGKSLILELAQFALFGTAALRGKADDYKALMVELDFTVNKIKYNVLREGSKVVLTCETGPLATGTKPVNAAILKILGYSYDVFKVANVAEQGCIERLGAMLPTARKRLVDETIGLTALDALSEFIAKEATKVSTTIKALEPVVVAPVEPVKPEGLQEVEAYATAQTTLAELSNQRAVLLSKLTTQPVEPALVVLCGDDAKLEEYIEISDARLALTLEAQVLLRQQSAIPAAKTLGEVKLHERDAEMETLREEYQVVWTQTQSLLMYQRELTIPEALYTAEQLDAVDANNLLLKRWTEKKKLQSENVPHDCPACAHHWEDEDPRVKSEYADVPDDYAGWFSPLTDKQIEQARTLLLQQPRRLELLSLIEDLTAKMANAVSLPMTERLIKDIEAARVKFAAAEVDRTNARKLAVIKKELEDLINRQLALPDHTADILRVKVARQNRKEYLTAYQQYVLAVEAYDKAAVQLLAIPADLNEQITANSNGMMSAIEYASNLAHYLKLKEDYDKLSVQLDEHRLNLLDWQSGKTAVADLKARVKGFIIPSLNMVSSKLVNEMTGGELSTIQITEDFEIAVDGVRLELLSGAGKGVANLALRLSLGQVLTNAVFPGIFLDEIDASFDDERAGYTSECLRRLTGVFKQVIIVSHKKDLEADHYVRL